VSSVGELDFGAEPVPLRKGEDRYRRLVDSIDGIVWEARPDFTFTFVSRQAERILGFPAERWVSEPGFWASRLHPEDRDYAIAFCQEQTARLVPHTFEYRMIAADGRVVWLRDLVSVEARDGAPLLLTGIMVDVTALRETESRLERGEERLRKLIESAEEGVWLVDENDRTSLVNAKMASIVGYRPEEMLGHPPFDFMDEEQRLQSMRNLRERRRGLSARVDARLRRKDGRSRWVSIAGSPVLDRDGRYNGTVAMVADIHDRRRNEFLLQAQTDIFGLLLEGKGLNDALHRLAEAVERMEDNALVSILLVAGDGRRYGLGAAPSFPEDLRRAIDGAILNPEAGSCGVAIARRELVICEDVPNDPRWAPYPWVVDRLGVRTCWSIPFFARDNSILGTFAIYFRERRKPDDSDLQLLRGAAAAAALVVEHVKTREALNESITRLEESEERFRILADAGVDGVVIHEKGKILLANANQARIFGYEVAELEKMSVVDITAPESLPLVRENLGGLSKPPYLILCRRRDGSTFWGEVRSRDGFFDGRPVRVSTLRDVTDRKLWEEQRERALEQERAAKLEAERNIRLRDDFLAIASHELKTPLTPLKLDLQLQRRYLRQVGLPPSHQTNLLFHAIDHADREYQRLSDLVDDLLDVSRISAGYLALKRSRFDLSALARDVLDRLSRPIARAKCLLEMTIVPDVVGDWDPSRLEQVLTNLVTNAIKYGAGAPVHVDLFLRDGRAVLRVRDHGIGIDPEHHATIFERFVRLAPLEHYGGLGLGLFIVHEIVKAHGGTISVESAKGKGATFTVELPCG